jgi:hypothetical protein
MKNHNTSGCRRVKTHSCAHKKNFSRQSNLILLALIAFALGGCLSEQVVQDAIKECIEKHKEEFVLLLNIPTYFGYSEENGKYLLPDKTVSPLYNFLVTMTNNKQPDFALTTTVIHFHYPIDYKEITTEERVTIGVSEVGYPPQTVKPVPLRSNLSVFERDNNNETGVLYAQCRFLLQVYGYPAGTDSETGNFVWLFCRCTWDSEKQKWTVSNIRRLSDGEAVLEHY